ncbi:MAG: class I mannose-6-phosphate isomerase [Chitinophagaceae bacterium]
MLEIRNREEGVSEQQDSRFRKSAQAIMPYRVAVTNDTNGYDIYPYRGLGSEKIFNGYDSLVRWMSDFPCIIIDGFSGVLWDEVQSNLSEAFAKEGLKVRWIRAEQFLKPATELEKLVAPFLGDRDSVWGIKTTLELEHFFQVEKIRAIKEETAYNCNIIIGTGASLAEWDAPIVYLDVPKNEIQYRMRAGAVNNLGMSQPDEPAHMYKQCYFVDWVVLNQSRERINDRITVQVDSQWENTINWMFAKDLANGLNELSETVLRVRPWFEPGTWGGHWMQGRFDGLNKDEVNYAWSFELIVPENGLVFESDGYLLEVPFDLLMSAANKKILGKHADFFGKEFPIRFDFLDTWEGGNLSIQCHPSVKYIRQHFGEHITQDETYYILDCKPGAKVYLGFQEDIKPKEFRKVLENSKANGEEIKMEKYVQAQDAQKHDLFLIPNGTIHSAGADNLVLEISSTPYIFTFKMYDWLRLDLNGEPRAINIEHAFNNLRFERKGEKVKQELISQPKLIEKNVGVQVWHLPTHAEHFYDVHRLEFDSEVTVNTNDSCNVLMLVEGTSIIVKIGEETQQFHYAETFVIPAAVKNYTIINEGSERAKVVKAFIKDLIGHLK